MDRYLSFLFIINLVFWGCDDNDCITEKSGISEWAEGKCE